MRYAFNLSVSHYNQFDINTRRYHQSSETAPTQGTLKVFPDVLLSNAYLILRPFFTPTISPESDEIFDIKHWKFG
jgi:hypothetical protein